MALLFTLSPFVLIRMQYTYEITGIFSGVAACVFGFWLVLKAGGLDKINQPVNQSINQF